MDDLNDTSMGGYGHEEERERRRIQDKISAGIPIDMDEDEDEDREAVFSPAVQSLVAALGGWEDAVGEDGEVTRFYRPGDSIVGCLRDLKKLWRKDDTDDERTVARIFSKSGIIRDLVAIVEEVSDRGPWGMKVGLMAADLLTAMTWPIDVAAELKEMEDEPPTVTDYGSLLAAQLDYKATILRSGVLLQKMMALVLPSLAKASNERQEKDERIISLILHLIRNLLQVKDLVSSSFSSTDRLEKSTLQSLLIVQLESSSFLPLLLTLASSALLKDFNPFNVLVLDILQLLFQPVSAVELAKDQKSAPREGLESLLAQENLVKQSSSRNAASRHSRFGTAISIRQGGDTSGQKVVLNRSNAIQGDAGSLLDQRKKKGRAGGKGARKADELARPADLTPEAMTTLQRFSTEFLESCFNNFFSSILKDIRMERQKVREADNVRALFLSTFFIEFFLCSRARALARESDKKGKGKVERGTKTASEWDFGYVAEFSEIEAVKWVVARMRLTMDDKPIGWTELQAGINCFTQILLLIDAMAVSSDEEAVEAAEIMQNQIYYNGDILDMAHLVVLKFKDQSLAYLDAVIHLNYVLLRMLEKYSKVNSYMYVRKRKAKRAKRKRIKNGEPLADENGGDDDEEEADRGAARYAEHAFTFEKFALRFAQEDILRTYLTYLERFAEFSSPDRMKRIVNLLHRLAVGVKAEGLFFKVSVLDLFQTILTHQLSLPKDPSSKDLLTLINFILRKFFKRAQEEPFLIVEAFFPKNRDHWKKFSSWAPEDGEASGGDEGTSRVAKKVKIPTDVQIKDKNLSPSQQIGVAVAILLEAEKMLWVTWTAEILKDVAAARQEIVLSTDGIPEQAETDEEIRAQALPRGPSDEALAKFTVHHVTADDEERNTAMSMNPHLKLLFRLVDFELASAEDVIPYEWTIPADILPSELEANAIIIEQFIREPLDLDGEKATDKLKRKIRSRRKRKRSPISGDEEGEEKAKRPRKKKKEAEVQKHYLSAEFIYDSDDDRNDEAFFALERERIARRARDNELSVTSAPIPRRKPTQTKAPARPKPKPKKGKNRRRDSMSRASSAAGSNGGSEEEEAQASSGDWEEEEEEVRPKPRARPKGRAKKAHAPAETFGDGSDDEVGLAVGIVTESPTGSIGSGSEGEREDVVSQVPRARKRVVVESDESE